MDVKTITQRLGFSRNYWSAVENERKILAEDSLNKLLELFEFDEEERAELHALRAAAKARGWWTGYSAVLDEEVQRLFGLEAGAHSVRVYESLLIPGLLQTTAYARSLITPDVNVRRVEVDQIVEARLRRQHRLLDKNPLRLTALISEAAFRQEIGGRVVLRGQLEHLVNMLERYPDTIDLRVIPFTMASCGLFGGAGVSIIDFRNPRLPTVVWQETVTFWGVINDPNKVRAISGTYRDAECRSLSRQQTLELLHRRVGELGRPMRPDRQSRLAQGSDEDVTTPTRWERQRRDQNWPSPNPGGVNS
jgi:hypothetical protein